MSSLFLGLLSRKKLKSKLRAIFFPSLSGTHTRRQLYTNNHRNTEVHPSCNLWSHHQEKNIRPLLLVSSNSSSDIFLMSTHLSCDFVLSLFFKAPDMMNCLLCTLFVSFNVNTVESPTTKHPYERPPFKSGFSRLFWSHTCVHEPFT